MVTEPALKIHHAITVTNLAYVAFKTTAKLNSSGHPQEVHMMSSDGWSDASCLALRVMKSWRNFPPNTSCHINCMNQLSYFKHRATCFLYSLNTSQSIYLYESFSIDFVLICMQPQRWIGNLKCAQVFVGACVFHRSWMKFLRQCLMLWNEK